MADTPLVTAARQWVIDNYPYNRHHLLRSLDWLDEIAPGSREAVRIATVTHDMERAFPGPDQPVNGKLNDPAYDTAHAERSARIVGAWLRGQTADESLVKDVEALLRAHEVGGWPEANLVQAADRLSFLETNIDLFLGFARSGKFPVADIGVKFDLSLERIQIPHAYALAVPMRESARARLAALEFTLPNGNEPCRNGRVSPFAYARPETLDEALALLETHGAEARILAGGTDVMVRLRLGHMTPRVVVDLKRVKGLSAEIVEVDSCLRVGTRVVMTDLLNDARIRRHYPALIEAASVVGSVQIRNRATLVGNICNASPAADTSPALLAYGALVNLVSRIGRRRVPLTDFFTGPGRTVRTIGEIVESIDLPLPTEATGAAFGRITRRYGVDLATINLVCRVTASGQTRFAYGAVGPKVFLVQDESGMLAERAGDVASRDALLRSLIAHASPISDLRGSHEYRLAMLEVMSRRALRTSLDRLKQAQKEA